MTIKFTEGDMVYAPHIDNRVHRLVKHDNGVALQGTTHTYSCNGLRYSADRVPSIFLANETNKERLELLYNTQFDDESVLTQVSNLLAEDDCIGVICYLSNTFTNPTTHTGLVVDVVRGKLETIDGSYTYGNIIKPVYL